jgi:hypothetical protein
MAARRRQRRLQHCQTLLQPPSTPSSPVDRVAALAWTPTTTIVAERGKIQLAVAVAAGARGRPEVQLFDAEGRRVDRIPLKPAVKVSEAKRGKARQAESS